MSKSQYKEITSISGLISLGNTGLRSGNVELRKDTVVGSANIILFSKKMPNIFQMKNLWEMPAARHLTKSPLE